MKKMQCAGLGLLLAMVGVVGSGCAVLLVGAAAGAGAGTVAYIKGELRSVEVVGYDQAWTATLAALKDLELAVTEQTRDAQRAKITARGAGDRKVVVTLIKQTTTTTEFRIRVGTFGDEPFSHQILDKIKSRF